MLPISAVRRLSPEQVAIGVYGTFLVIGTLGMAFGAQETAPARFLATIEMWRFGGGILVGGLVGAALSRLGIVFAERTALGRSFAIDMARALTTLRPRYRMVTLIVGSIAEELVFRGVLQTHVGVWIASLLFACLHVGVAKPRWVWPLSALIAGMLFGGLYIWTGVIVAPIAAHVVNNVLSARYLGRLRTPSRVARR